jgi:hypothetical protein
VTISDVAVGSKISFPLYLNSENWNLASLNLSFTLLNWASIFSSFSAATINSSISSAYLTGFDSTISLNFAKHYPSASGIAFFSDSHLVIS